MKFLAQKVFPWFLLEIISCGTGYNGSQDQQKSRLLTYIVPLNSYQAPISQPILAYLYKADAIKPWFYNDGKSDVGTTMNEMNSIPFENYIKNHNFNGRRSADSSNSSITSDLYETSRQLKLSEFDDEFVVEFDEFDEIKDEMALRSLHEYTDDYYGEDNVEDEIYSPNHMARSSAYGIRDIDTVLQEKMKAKGHKISDPSNSQNEKRIEKSSSNSKVPDTHSVKGYLKAVNGSAEAFENISSDLLPEDKMEQKGLVGDIIAEKMKEKVHKLKNPPNSGKPLVKKPDNPNEAPEESDVSSAETELEESKPILLNPSSKNEDEEEETPDESHELEEGTQEESKESTDEHENSELTEPVLIEESEPDEKPAAKKQAIFKGTHVILQPAVVVDGASEKAKESVEGFDGPDGSKMSPSEEVPEENSFKELIEENTDESAAITEINPEDTAGDSELIEESTDESDSIEEKIPEEQEEVNEISSEEILEESINLEESEVEAMKEQKTTNELNPEDTGVDNEAVDEKVEKTGSRSKVSIKLEPTIVLSAGNKNGKDSISNEKKVEETGEDSSEELVAVTVDTIEETSEENIDEILPEESPDLTENVEELNTNESIEENTDGQETMNELGHVDTTEDNERIEESTNESETTDETEEVDETSKEDTTDEHIIEEKEKEKDRKVVIKLQPTIMVTSKHGGQVIHEPDSKEDPSDMVDGENPNGETEANENVEGIEQSTDATLEEKLPDDSGNIEENTSEEPIEETTDESKILEEKFPDELENIEEKTSEEPAEESTNEDDTLEEQTPDDLENILENTTAEETDENVIPDEATGDADAVEEIPLDEKEHAESSEVGETVDGIATDAPDSTEKNASEELDLVEEKLPGDLEESVENGIAKPSSTVVIKLIPKVTIQKEERPDSGKLNSDTLEPKSIVKLVPKVYISGKTKHNKTENSNPDDEIKSDKSGGEKSTSDQAKSENKVNDEREVIQQGSSLEDSGMVKGKSQGEFGSFLGISPERNDKDATMDILGTDSHSSVISETASTKTQGKVAKEKNNTEDDLKAQGITLNQTFPPSINSTSTFESKIKTSVDAGNLEKQILVNHQKHKIKNSVSPNLKEKTPHSKIYANKDSVIQDKASDKKDLENEENPEKLVNDEKHEKGNKNVSPDLKGKTPEEQIDTARKTANSRDETYSDETSKSVKTQDEMAKKDTPKKVDSNETGSKKPMCNDLVCPDETVLCSTKFTSLPPDFKQSRMTSECLSEANDVLLNRESIVKNISPGHYLQTSNTIPIEYNTLDVNLGDFFVPNSDQ